MAINYLWKLLWDDKVYICAFPDPFLENHMVFFISLKLLFLKFNVIFLDAKNNQKLI